MQVVIRSTKKLGLEVWQVYVNGIFESEHMSRAGAMTKAQRLINKLAA